MTMNCRDDLPLSAQEMAILRTVCYSSIFRFPLRERELVQGLIGLRLRGAGPLEIYRKSPRLQRVIDYQAGYFFPSGCSSWLEDRGRRTRTTHQLLQRYRLPLRLICLLPYTRLVALSGSAAFENMEEAEDIDLFLVTSRGRVWMTALTILLLARLLRCRQAICFNFLLSESELKLKQCDLFTASQTISLTPLIGSEVYREMLGRNPEVRDLYPNVREPGQDQMPAGSTARLLKRALESILQIGPGFVLERVSRLVYEKHLRKKAHTWESPEEVVLGSQCLKLHTRSHRKRVLDRYEQKVQEAVSLACRESVVEQETE